MRPDNSIVEKAADLDLEKAMREHLRYRTKKQKDTKG